jgi:hypothetical protein
MFHYFVFHKTQPTKVLGYTFHMEEKKDEEYYIQLVENYE